MLHRHRHGVIRIHGHAGQGLLQGAGHARRIARRKVPGRGGNDLVVLDSAMLHADPVPESTAGRLTNPMA